MMLVKVYNRSLYVNPAHIKGIQIQDKNINGDNRIEMYLTDANHEGKLSSASHNLGTYRTFEEAENEMKLIVDSINKKWWQFWK